MASPEVCMVDIKKKTFQILPLIKFGCFHFRINILQFILWTWFESSWQGVRLAPQVDILALNYIQTLKKQLIQFSNKKNILWKTFKYEWFRHEFRECKWKSCGKKSKANLLQMTLTCQWDTRFPKLLAIFGQKLRTSPVGIRLG